MLDAISEILFLQLRCSGCIDSLSVVLGLVELVSTDNNVVLKGDRSDISEVKK
jgi:hypothetical protein